MRELTATNTAVYSGIQRCTSNVQTHLPPTHNPRCVIRCVPKPGSYSRQRQQRQRDGQMDSDALLLMVAGGAASVLLLLLGPWLVRRYRAFHARRAGARIVPVGRSSLVSAASYPMYVLPVRTLLNELHAFVPHRELLAQGKLVQATPHMANQIIFVSRESYAHAIPPPSLLPLAPHALRDSTDCCTIHGARAPRLAH